MSVNFISSFSQEPNAECPICLTGIDSAESCLLHRVKTSAEGVFSEHAFHSGCLSQSLLSKRLCPLCRGSVSLPTPLDALKTAPEYASLFHGGSIDRHHGERLLLEAVQNDRQPIAEGLILSGQIDPKIRIKALSSAIQNKNLSLIQSLLNGCSMDFYSFCKALNQSIQSSSQEIFDFFVHRGGVDEHSRGPEIALAVHRGQTNDVLDLLRRFPMKKRLFGIALVLSAQERNIDLVESLLRMNSAEPEAVKAALISAAKNTDLRLIDLLLKTKQLAHAQIKEAIEATFPDWSQPEVQKLLSNKSNTADRLLLISVSPPEIRPALEMLLNALPPSVSLRPRAKRPREEESLA